MSDKEKEVKKDSAATDAVKKEKVGFFTKAKKLLLGYKSEWKKIVWPSFKQVRNNTVVTIAMILVVGAFIWVLDFALQLGLGTILDKF